MTQTLPTKEQIDNCKTTSELYSLIEDSCGKYLKNSDSWGDSAARASNEGNFEVEKILLEAERRWFELDGNIAE